MWEEIIKQILICNCCFGSGCDLCMSIYQLNSLRKATTKNKWNILRAVSATEQYSELDAWTLASDNIACKRSIRDHMCFFSIINNNLKKKKNVFSTMETSNINKMVRKEQRSRHYRHLFFDSDLFLNPKTIHRIHTRTHVPPNAHLRLSCYCIIKL